MRCRSLGLLSLLGVSFLIGCGGSGTSAPVAGTSGSAPSDPIALVVYEFFNAVRQGQTAAANQWLTPLALQRITEQDMNIAPPGSATASFQVGQVTTRENDHALVSLVWSDLDSDGKPSTEHLLCELRVSEGQWRICGMAQDLGPGQPPAVLDFEQYETPAVAQAPAKTPPGPTAVAPFGTGPTKEMATDPFQQPVQR